MLAEEGEGVTDVLPVRLTTGKAFQMNPVGLVSPERPNKTILLRAEYQDRVQGSQREPGAISRKPLFRLFSVRIRRAEAVKPSGELSEDEKLGGTS